VPRQSAGNRLMEDDNLPAGQSFHERVELEILEKYEHEAG